MAWFRTGGGGIPASLKTDMNSVLNKKLGTETTYTPETWPENVNLLGKLPEKIYVGTIGVAEDGAAMVPVKYMQFTIPYNETGTSKIVITKTGYNILTGVWNSAWLDNNGIYTSWSGRLTSDKIPVVEGATYFFNCQQRWRYCFYGENDEVLTVTPLTTQTANVSKTLTAPSGAKYLRFAIPEAETTGAVVNYPSEIQTYEPYSTPEITEVELGKTVYGGTANITTGIGEDENGVEFTFAPVEIETTLGVNIFTHNVVDIEFVYRRDIELALQSGPALMMMARPPLMQQNQENAEEANEPEETEDDSN